MIMANSNVTTLPAINSSFDGQPRAADCAIAKVLALSSTDALRKLIARHAVALSCYGDVPQDKAAYWLNEAQAVYISTKTKDGVGIAARIARLFIVKPVNKTVRVKTHDRKPSAAKAAKNEGFQLDIAQGVDGLAIVSARVPMSVALAMAKTYAELIAPPRVGRLSIAA